MRKALRRSRKSAYGLLLRARHAVEAHVSRIPPPPPVTAKACYVIHRQSRLPIFAKNAWISWPPASLTKLATSILFANASEGRWSEVVEVLPGDIIRGSTMDLSIGEVVSRQDILLGMLLASGNDAAHVAARLIGSDWLLQLNALCKRLDMRRSRFVNPDGRDQSDQRSCARDLAILAAEAFSNPTIAAAAGLASHVVNGREIRSTVEILGTEGIHCGKTGSTHAAGACLALGYRDFIICILGSDGSFRGGRVIPETDRRYEDASRIIRALEEVNAAAS